MDLLWEEFNLPIWVAEFFFEGVITMLRGAPQVTEFDWNANKDVEMGDHSLHAEQIHNFYTLMFSLEVLFNV